MIDFEYESNRNLVQLYGEELIQLSRGQKLDHQIRKLLRNKGLITQDHRNSNFKLTDLALKLLEEIKP